METKHGAIDLTELAIGIMVLGIVVSIGASILTTFRDSRLTSTQVLTTNNETLSLVNESGSAIAVGTNEWFKGELQVYNETGVPTVIPTTHYDITINPVSGDATIATSATGAAGAYNNTAWNMTYQVYNKSDPQWALPNDASLGLLEYGNWFTILVIVGIAAVVLSLIFLTLGNKKSPGAVNF